MNLLKLQWYTTKTVFLKNYGLTRQNLHFLVYKCKFYALLDFLSCVSTYHIVRNSITGL